jgi:ferredoxin
MKSTVKVRVDPERRQGHTLCSMIAPDVFSLDEIDEVFALARSAESGGLPL